MYLRLARRQGCNLVILEAAGSALAALEETRPKERTIHVWFEDDASGRLKLLFAYLVTRSESWKLATIRLYALAHEGESAAAALARMEEMLEDVRIDAEPEIVEAVDAATILARSERASLVFLPFRLRGDELEAGFGLAFEGLIERLPLTALVLAAEDLDLDAAPEEGPQGEIAEAMDAAHATSENAVRAERAVHEAEKSLAEQRASLERARAEGGEAADIEGLAKACAEAERALRDASRRAAKAGAKAEAAERDVDAQLE